MSNNVNDSFKKIPSLDSVHASVRTFLWLFFLFCGVVRVFDYHIAAANYQADSDSIINYIRLFSNPGLFSGDSVLNAAAPQMYATLMNIVGIGLFSITNLSPEFIAALFVVSEVVLIGISMYRLSLHAYKSPWTAVVASLLMLSMCPWNYNLANYGIDLNYPYAAFFAIAFIVFAVAWCIDGKYKKMGFFLVLGAFFHVSLTLYAVVSIGIYFLFMGGWGRNNLMRGLGHVLPSILVVFGMAFVARLNSSGAIATGKILDALLKNFHTVPWDYTPYWVMSLPSTVGWCCLVCLGLYVQRSERGSFSNSRYTLFLLCSLVGALFFFFLHYLSVKISFIPGIQLIGSRAVVLTVIVGLPVLADLFVRCLGGGRLVAACAALELLWFMGTHRYGWFWGPMAAIFLVFLLDEEGASSPVRRRKGSLLGVVVLGVWHFMLAMGWKFDLSGGVLGDTNLWAAPGLWGGTAAELLAQVKVVIALCAVWVCIQVAAGKVWKNNPRRLSMAGIFFVFILSLFLVVSLSLKDADSLWRGKRAVALYEAQSWALENTDPGTVFMTDGVGFRTVSQRPNQPMAWSGQYPYFANEQAVALDDKLLKFYDLEREFPALDRERLFARLSRKIAALDERRLIELASITGAEYFVARKGYRRSLPVAYSNDVYTIYRTGADTPLPPEGSGRPEKLEVAAYGPTVVQAGQPFNEQPDGSSALWVQIAPVKVLSAIPQRVLLVWAGHTLETAWVPDTLSLSATVPARLFQEPGEIEVVVQDADSGRALTSFTLVVTP